MDSIHGWLNIAWGLSVRIYNCPIVIYINTLSNPRKFKFLIHLKEEANRKVSIYSPSELLKFVSNKSGYKLYTDCCILSPAIVNR